MIGLLTTVAEYEIRVQSTLAGSVSGEPVSELSGQRDPMVSSPNSKSAKKVIVTGARSGEDTYVLDTLAVRVATAWCRNTTKCKVLHRLLLTTRLTRSRFTGIGLGIALAFLRSHDHVVLVSRSIDLESLSESKEEMERFVASGQAFLLQKDVSDVRLHFSRFCWP